MAINAKTSFKPVLFFDLFAGDGPVPVIDNAVKSLSVVNVTGGKIKSLDPEYPFEADIFGGADELTTLKSGTHSNLNCRIYAKTSSSGKGVFVTYGGVVKTNEKIFELIGTEKPKELTFEDAYVTCNPFFELDADIEAEFKWVTSHNFVGKGRFIRDEDSKLKVQYYIYIVE